jgi:alanyl-tRNA synthetase
MGLERVAKVLQNVESVYETDRMKPIMEKVRMMRGKELGVRDKETTRHERIIVDHIKAATFMIADGVKPGNVDQAYVLRRIIRRAIRSARALGIEHAGSFTPTIAEEVINQYGHIYGHVKSKEKDIRDTLSHEEQQFGKTLLEGLKRFSKMIDELQGKTIDGVTAFHLYDTYGFPFELTKEMATEHGLSVDEEGFKKAFEEHQTLSRAGAEQKFKGGLADHSAETTKLHTATHLLNAALHKMLGNHIGQKGSNITAERLRFDFNYDGKMTPEQIAEVEKLVNDAIKADLPVSYHVTTVSGAKEEGAIGVFDDKYGSEVKVYVMGDCDSATAGTGDVNAGPVFSKEICGGPHVAKTSMLGTFKIQKEESSSAGVRRIKAIVSGGPAEIEVAKER